MCKSKNKIGRKVMSFILSVAMVLAYYMPEISATKVKADGETPTGYLTGINDTLTDNPSDPIPDDWYIKLGEEGQAFYSKIETDYDSSYNDEDSALEIDSASKLAAFAKFVNDGSGRPDNTYENSFNGKFVKLTADIDLEGNGIEFKKDIDSNGDFTVTIARGKDEDNQDVTPKNLWKPIGVSGRNFRGTFDGQGHEIRNMLAIDKSNSSNAYAGLFGGISDSTIHHVAVTMNSKSYAYCGWKYDYAQPFAAAGGFAGSMGYGRVHSCYSECDSFSVSLHYSYAGGLIGRSDGTLENCYATGCSCSCGYREANAGGLLGAWANSSGQASCCYSIGNAYCCKGVDWDDSGRSGGLLGYFGYYSHQTSCCFSAGDAYSYAGSGAYGESAGLGCRSSSQGEPNITHCYRSGNGHVMKGDVVDNTTIGTDGTEMEINNFKGNVNDKLDGFNWGDAWAFVDGEFPMLRGFKYIPYCTPPAGITAAVGQNLGEITLDNPNANTPGTWSWMPDQNVSDLEGEELQTFLASFEPLDTDTYGVPISSIYRTMRNIEIEVLVVSLPTGLSSNYGDSLSSVSLPDNWEWDNENEVITNIGVNKFLANFTPMDKNYNAISVYLDVLGSKGKITENLFDCQPPADLNYNGTPKVATVITDRDGMGAITVKYNSVNQGAILTEAPSKVGSYEVCISVDEGEFYSATENDIKVGEFSIVNNPDLNKNIEITESPYVDAENNTYWYKDSLPVEIKATGEGYKISESPTGGFVKSLRLLDSDSEHPTGIYLQNEEGYITEEIFLPSFRWDNKPIKGEIKIGENIWTKVLSVITFGLLFKDSAQATITCTGDENPTSGVSERQYLITDVPLLNDSSATDDEKANALSKATGWISFEGESITVDLPKGKNVVYARFVDNVGHVTYVSSDGVVVYSDEDTSPTEVDKSGWGEPKEINGIMHYIDANGKTSVEVPSEQGIVWLKAESDGMRAWYGFDNRTGVFEPGSRAYVQWLSKNDPDYEKYLTQSDALIKIGAEGENIRIFRLGVVRPNGERYSNLEETTNLYVQIGDDWNKDDVKGYYIGEAEGESVDTTVTNETCPEGEGLFGVMKLKHFSPYLIYDKLKENDVEKTEDTEQYSKNGTQNKVDHSEELDEDLDEYDELLRKLLEEIDEPENLVEKTPIKPTGDINASRSISTLGVLTLLSAAYLMLRKKKSSQI